MKANIHARCLGMLEDVGERFLGNTVQNQLDLRRETLAESIDRVFRHDSGLVLEALGGRAERFPQPEIVQGWWSQLERQTTDALDRLDRHILQFLRESPDLVVARCLERCQPQELGEQNLRGVIVQLARDSLPFVLLRLDDLVGQELQLLPVTLELVQCLIERLGKPEELGIAESPRFGTGRKIAMPDRGRHALQTIQRLERNLEDPVVHGQAQDDAEPREQEREPLTRRNDILMSEAGGGVGAEYGTGEDDNGIGDQDFVEDRHRNQLILHLATRLSFINVLGVVRLGTCVVSCVFQRPARIKPPERAISVHFGTLSYCIYPGSRRISLASTSSFDIVSKFDRQELKNAIDQAEREIRTRYDLKDSNTDIQFGDNDITITTANEYTLQAVTDTLESKVINRKLSLKILDYQEAEDASGARKRQVIKLREGIPDDIAKKISKQIRDQFKKVTPQIQGDTLRVQAKSRDDLQGVIQLLKDEDFPVALQFVNYR